MSNVLSPLISDRLILRFPTEEDGPEIFFLRSDPEINKYVIRPQPKNLEEACTWIRDRLAEIQEGKLYYWSITMKGNPRMIGSICLWNLSDDHKQAEVGYDLHPDFHGKGIMDESLKAVLGFGFDTLALDQVEAYTQKNNEASKKLLLRNGFVHLVNRVCDTNPMNWIYLAKKP